MTELNVLNYKNKHIYLICFNNIYIQLLVNENNPYTVNSLLSNLYSPFTTHFNTKSILQSLEITINNLIINPVLSIPDNIWYDINNKPITLIQKRKF